MNLHLIGTGSIGAIERSASALIDGKILIDCGNGIVKTIMEQGYDIGKIETIFITHLHGDHYMDLPFYILTKYFSGAKSKTKIYCPKDTEKKVKELFNGYAFGDCDYEETKNTTNIEFIEFENLKDEKILEGYNVNSYLVDHVLIKPAYGYTIEKDGKTIGFSGDSIYCDVIDEIIEKSEYSVLDMSAIKRKKAHMGLDDIEIICDKYKDKRIVATHMNNEVRDYAKTLNISNLIIPNDGDEIKL